MGENIDSEEPLDFEDIMSGIGDAFESLSGDEVARVYNSICGKKIRYDEDSVWGFTGEDDNDS